MLYTTTPLHHSTTRRATPLSVQSIDTDWPAVAPWETQEINKRRLAFITNFYYDVFLVFLLLFKGLICFGEDYY